MGERRIVLSLRGVFERLRGFLKQTASDQEVFRGFFFKVILAVSACASLSVALSEQSGFILPDRQSLIRTMMLLWVLCHVPLYALGRSARWTAVAYSIYLYAAFVVLSMVFQSLNVAPINRVVYQLPQNYSLLFAALLLLPRNRYLVYSTVICGGAVVWVLCGYGHEAPPVTTSAVSALTSHIFGQWALGAVASMLMESHLRQMVESRTELARHNERLGEEVAEKAEMIRQQQERLHQSQKMEAIGQLAGGVAHDFNNLITVIHGHGELLLRELPEDAPLREHAAEILHASRSSSDLTRQLLAFSRRQVMELSLLDLNSVVKNMEWMLRRLIGEGVELLCVLSEEVCPVTADPTQMEQVIVNLAVNARDSMEKGGRLTLRTSRSVIKEGHPGLEPGDYVQLAVEDTGCGMSDEVMGHIFEPFFTTKGTGKGTGLGLSTVYGIVKQVGGEVEVRSEPGKGSVFTIYLPATEGVIDEPRPEQPSAKIVFGSETVLLVEDKEKVRAVIAGILKEGGYTLLECGDPQAAPALLEEYMGHVHVLLTDVLMPGMNGVELEREILRISPATRVLFMSGYAGDEVVQKEILEAGKAFIPKPMTRDALLRKVREVLDAVV